MTVNNMIGEIWAARLLANMNKALIYGQIGVINKNFEGEIKNRGDTVHINAIAPITSRPYVKNVPIEPAETLSDAATTLVIDQANYTNFELDSVDKAQTVGNIMDESMAESAYALGDDADQYIVAQMVANVAEANKLGTDISPIVPGTAAGTTTFDYLVDLNVLLNEANAPKVGRWVVISPWLTGTLVKDSRFSNISASGSPEALRNGWISRVAGMDVYESNNVPQTGGELYKIVAGCTSAVTYADQILDVVAYKPEDAFSDAIKALHLFGAKVVRPSALALMTCSKTA